MIRSPLIILILSLLLFPASAALGQEALVEDEEGDLSVSLYDPETGEYNEVDIGETPITLEELAAVDILGFSWQKGEEENAYEVLLAGPPSEDAFYSVEVLEQEKARSRSPLVLYYSPDGSAFATDGAFRGYVQSIEPEFEENSVIFYSPANVLPEADLQFHIISTLLLEKEEEEYWIEDVAGVEFEEPVSPPIDYRDELIALGITAVISGIAFYFLLKG